MPFFILKTEGEAQKAKFLRLGQLLSSTTLSINHSLQATPQAGTDLTNVLGVQIVPGAVDLPVQSGNRWCGVRVTLARYPIPDAEIQWIEIQR